jgi:peptide/nickel transport system ATP-binding protein
MLQLKEEREIAFLYVTHDLGSARYVADDILVMYAGQIVERGPTEQVLSSPLHPYTRLLLSAVPDPHGMRALAEVGPRGTHRGAVDPVAGCRFVERCPLAIDRCTLVSPPLVEARPITGHSGHGARCHVTAPAPTPGEEPPS